MPDESDLLGPAKSWETLRWMRDFVTSRGHKWTVSEARACFEAEKWLLEECEARALKYTFGYIRGMDVPFREGFWIRPNQTFEPCSQTAMR